MDHNEIIKALIIIRDICGSTRCLECPFRTDNEKCGIVSNGWPSYWNIKSSDSSWRAFK